MILQTEEQIREFCHDIDLATYNYDISPDYKIILKKPVLFVFYKKIEIAEKYDYCFPVIFKNLPAKTEFVLSNLKTLENIPKKIPGGFSVHKSNLTSLKGIPEVINGSCGISLSKDNPMTEIDYLPKTIKEYFVLSGNFKTLKNIHKKCSSIGQEFAIECNIESNILGLLLIKNVEVFNSGLMSRQEFTDALKIINKHYKRDGSGDVLECQEELIENGLKEFAKL